MITDVFFPRINGVSTSIETFRADLACENIIVKLVAPAYPQPQQGQGIWRVPSRRLPFDPEDRLMHWRPLLDTSQQVADAGIDLIHVQTPFAAHYAGARLARQCRVPMLATYHTHFEEYIQHYLPLIPRRILQALARRVARHQCDSLDAVIVPSPAMQDTLRGYGVRAPLHVLPTGIPVSQFANGSRERFRSRHDIAPRRPVALYVGRVAHEKNIPFLLQALPHALSIRPDLLLVIAGEGPALASLRDQAGALGIADHVRFVGYLDRHGELPDCYAAADLFVFASRTETQGLVLLEAMAAALPVYALAHLGTCSIVDPGRGVVPAPQDVAAFGRGWGELIGDHARLAALGRQGRDFALEWSAPGRARQLASLYRALVV